MPHHQPIIPDSGPQLSPNYSYVFNFEQSFEYASKRDWMAENWHTSFYWVSAYMLILLIGQQYMAAREAFKCRKALVIWSGSLAIFSIVGTLRTLPEMLHVLYYFGFQQSVCSPSYVENSRVAGFWTWLFCLSKVPELGDTVFIILRKQNLIFLHWYHHITVLLFTWYSYSEHISPGRWYIVMNYLVHSLMYSYYTLKALNIRVPKQIAMVITTSQIVQMIMGCFVTYYGYSLNTGGQQCQISEGTAKLALLMYGSYFLLFGRFFVNSYMGTGKTKRSPSTEKIDSCHDKPIQKLKRSKAIKSE